MRTVGAVDVGGRSLRVERRRDVHGNRRVILRVIPGASPSSPSRRFAVLSAKGPRKEDPAYWLPPAAVLQFASALEALAAGQPFVESVDLGGEKTLRLTRYADNLVVLTVEAPERSACEVSPIIFPTTAVPELNELLRAAAASFGEGDDV